MTWLSSGFDDLSVLRESRRCWFFRCHFIDLTCVFMWHLFRFIRSEIRSDVRCPQQCFLIEKQKPHTFRILHVAMDFLFIHLTFAYFSSDPLWTKPGKLWLHISSESLGDRSSNSRPNKPWKAAQQLQCCMPGSPTNHASVAVGGAQLGMILRLHFWGPWNLLPHKISRKVLVVNISISNIYPSAQQVSGCLR